MRYCLRHLSRPDGPLRLPGVGDCTTCMPDEKNQECAMYYPINVTEIEIKEKEK